MLRRMEALLLAAAPMPVYFAWGICEIRKFL
jgi:hypothetical protein